MGKLAWLVGLFLVSTGIFAALRVYSVGWDGATYNGYDPWAPLFQGLGGALFPLMVAAVIAGLRKLFSRSSSFLSTLLIVFAVATIFFAVNGFYVADYERSLR